MYLLTFALKNRAKYQDFWNRVQASNAHLTREPKSRAAWILEAVMSVKPNDILEIGCQTGGVTQFLLEITPAVTAVDIVESYLDIAKGMGAEVLLAFAEDLHQHDIGQFDSVVMTEVLNHVIDAEKATINAWAKVRPGGNLVVTVPIGNRWTDKSTAREFNSQADLMNILSAATGYSRIGVETLSQGGVDYFYVCNLRKRARKSA